MQIVKGPTVCTHIYTTINGTLQIILRTLRARSSPERKLETVLPVSHGKQYTKPGNDTLSLASLSQSFPPSAIPQGGITLRIMGKNVASHQDSRTRFRNLGLEHFLKAI